MTAKIQFKLVVDPRVRDIVAAHALQNDSDMSATITKVVEEVLLGELNAASLTEIKAKAKMREDEARTGGASGKSTGC
jgi:hypothetical protein